MIWKKNIYDSLTNCAAVCNEFAIDCSNTDSIERYYPSIFLNLDRADLCRDLASLYVRGSGSTRSLAKACIDVCEKCAQEVMQFNSERSRQVYEVCQQTISSCFNIIEMGRESGGNLAESTNANEPLVYNTGQRDRLVS